MWIETEIKGTFATNSGTQMVSFTAQRDERRTWAAPYWLVEKGLGRAPETGVAVRIEISGDRVGRVQLNRHQSAPTPSANAGSGTPRQAGAELGRRQPVESGQAASAVVLPYGFVPIDIEHTITDTPVWHDGSSGGALLSGEIRCELEAVTPLLPGNVRYKVEEADQGKLGIDHFQDLNKKKQIAEPLRLDDGRVVISGSAIKGMIRQSLGALTAAPMERVNEHHFSYRPNLDFNMGVIERFVVRPALVGKARNGGWDIQVFGDARGALFVRKEAEEFIRSAAVNGEIVGTVEGVERERKPAQGNRPPKITNHLVPVKGGSYKFSHRLALYRGGIDGEGLLAAAFNIGPGERVNGRVVCKEKAQTVCRGPFTYDLALVPRAGYTTLELSAQVYQRYLEDQRKVLANHESGHLTAHPLDVDIAAVENGIKANAEFATGQLIYVEVETDAEGKVTFASKVVSCGHHFRYRWAYTSSVRKKNGLEPRDCLSPLACELPPSDPKAPKDVCPEELTGARLLFGYVNDPKTNPIGKGVYERLAGRIAINHAVSIGVPKFLGEGKGYCLPLKILGQPKPSAWEFYLRQPKEGNTPPLTYGDLPGDAGGELRGRKFYRHQKSVSTSDIKAASSEERDSEQATLARFICAPGTRFKFAIRFMRLRYWELGALLAVLEPHLLKPGSKPERYAHKLGLGRPLGMGSVRITRKQVLLREEKDAEFFREAGCEQRIVKSIEALQERNPGTVDAWLEAHDASSGKRLGYPRAWTTVDRKPCETIFAWHTDLRREYSKLRRQRGAEWTVLLRGVRKAESGSG